MDQQRFQNTIRKLLSEPDNRSCFSCTQKGPVYIVVPFSIFVCTKCSGLHREFSFRVKGISMSNFTQEEVDELKKGGNGVARKLWLATWTPEDFPIPDPGDERKIKTFIRQCFVRAQWKELPPSEPLENLVGKEAVEALKIGKSNHVNKKQQEQQLPPPKQQPPPQESFNPFGAKTTVHQKGDDWDPWATPLPNAVPPQTVQAVPNPFGGFGQVQAPKTFDPFPPTSIPAVQPPPNQPVTPTVPFTSFPTESKQPAVDIHSLFVTPLPPNIPAQNVLTALNTPSPLPHTPLQPPLQPVHYPYPMVPPVIYMPSNPWVQTVAVPPVQAQVFPPQPIQPTGPDAFSGLLAGFGSRQQTSTATSPW